MAKKREISARQAKKNLEPFGYKGPARWSAIDAFVKATPRAKMAVTANAGLFVKEPIKANEGVTVAKSYINDSGTLMNEMSDGTVVKYGAAGNVVNVDSSGNVVSNVAGTHTLGSDLKKTDTVDLDDDQNQKLASLFVNPKIDSDDTFGDHNETARDYGKGILKGRGSRVQQLVNQGANVYLNDKGQVMLQTPDGSEAKLDYGAARMAFNQGLITGGKATYSAEGSEEGGGEEGGGEDTTTQTTNDPLVTDPVISSMPQTINLSPSQEEIDAASQIFQLNEDGTFKVNLPTGRESKVSTQTEDNQMTQVDTEGNVDTTTSTAPVQTFGDSVSNQVSDFEQRGIQQAQNINPQTLAEKMAVGQAGKLESRLYQNRLGMTTYVLGQYSPDGKTWNATQAVPQGYYPSKAGASYLMQQAAAAGQDNVVTADEGVLVDGEEETNTEDDGATVTVGNQQFTKEQVAQGQADLTAGAILNPKDTVGAAAVDAQNADASGTVMSATTGQANTTAPVVDDVSQVATVTTATTPNKPNLAKADLAQGTATVKDELKDVEAQQGTVTKEIEAQTQDTTKVGDQQAAQGTAAKVEGAPTRKLEEGEMIDGSAVDQTKVGETFGTGKVKAADVFEETERALEEFKDGTPIWARDTMNAAEARLNELGLSASSAAGQAIVDAMMKASMPLIQMNTANKQEMAMESARQRASFMKQEFDQNFQTKVMNAAKVSEIANLNFNSQQQIALENANMAQTMNLANLSNKQALVMAEAAQISQLELTSLNNRQQAQVQNAQNFLQMDMANLNNRQQTEIFKAQTVTNSILSDTAAANANAQFNASSENQLNQFYATMEAQVSQFNAAQTNAMAQFNAGEANAVKKFNSELQSGREQFNAKMSAQIAQANAKWRQDCETANTAAQNKSNAQYAKDINGLTNKSIDEIWQRERDLMNYAFNSSESAKDRILSIMLGDKELEAVKLQLDASNDDAFTENIMQLMFGEGGIGSIFGGKGLIGQFLTG
tara:strand:+ start:626 stop:3637 length:3012 start_codon:yes stop_codon:yes gene_type:complete